MVQANTKQVIVPTFSLIESKLLLLLPPSQDVAAPAWHLMQLYSAATEYISAVEKLDSITRNPGAILAYVKRIREIAKTLKHHSDIFATIYEQHLEIPLERSLGFAESKVPQHHNAKPSGGLAALHQRRGQLLLKHLQSAGCSELIAKKFVDDIMDLLWELESFTRQMDKLANIQKHDRASISHVIWQICYPWQRINFHLWYHLGEFEGEYSGLYNPGVLGWSLAVLSEVTRDETRKSKPKSAKRLGIS